MGRKCIIEEVVIVTIPKLIGKEEESGDKSKGKIKVGM